MAPNNLPNYLLSQWFANARPREEHFHFLQCRARGAKVSLGCPSQTNLLTKLRCSPHRFLSLLLGRRFLSHSSPPIAKELNLVPHACD